ncbi:MAG: DUF2203 domain-containing protein [Actinomycetota bacterium]
MSAERVFTVEEANAMLADLRGRLERIRGARHQVIAGAEQVGRSKGGNGGGAESAASIDASRVIREELEQVLAEGIIVRDPETGLVDFPAERDGEPVFLCWRLGEDDVGHWHDRESGFSSRRPL